MKAFTIPLAAIVLAATAFSAQAVPVLADGPAAFAAPFATSDTAEDVHDLHPCVGMTSGTAHHSCGGTATGGPVGGLM